MKAFGSRAVAAPLVPVLSRARVASKHSLVFVFQPNRASPVHIHDPVQWSMLRVGIAAALPDPGLVTHNPVLEVVQEAVVGTMDVASMGENVVD